jgi:hypothetical protein
MIQESTDKEDFEIMSLFGADSKLKLVNEAKRFAIQIVRFTALWPILQGNFLQHRAS